MIKTNIDYRILDDGYAALGSVEEMWQFFSDNDIIGKIVKQVDIFRCPDDLYFGFEIYQGVRKEYHGCQIKAVLSGMSPIIIVIAFTDESFLLIDDSDDANMFFKYSKEITVLNNMVLVDPAEYDCLFGNLTGEKFTGVYIPTEVLLSSKKGSLDSEILFDDVYLEFSGYDFDEDGKIRYYVDEDSVHKDILGFGFTVSHCPFILYYTDLNIDYYIDKWEEPPKEEKEMKAIMGFDDLYDE